MIKKITALMILQCIVINSYSQINSAFLNKKQRNVYSENLSKYGAVGYIEYNYSDDKELSKNEPNHFTVVILDSIGKIQKNIEFDENKKRGSYSIYEYDAVNQLRKKYNYKADNSILWIDEYLYDMSGELIESVQIGESGAINSKTLNYYNNAGYLDKSEIIGPDGNLTFTRSIKHNSQGLPTNVELKHTRRFTMSSDNIKYNENNLPNEKITSIGMTGKTSKFAYNYNQDNLIIEQRSWDEDKLKSIEITKYFTNKDFLSYLNKTGFEFLNLNGTSITISKKDYYLKSLAQYPGGEEALTKYLQENVSGSSSISDKGVVIIGFAVDLDGTITDIKIHRGVSKKADKQAIQIIKGMPKWIPAKKSDGDLYKSTASISIPFL